VTATVRVRRDNGTTVLAEVNPETGDPQVFPYLEVDDRVLRLVQEDPGNTHLQELAQQVRDHRAAYEARHTPECRADLRRGLCHWPVSSER
jgi:hypothetical protein